MIAIKPEREPFASISIRAKAVEQREHEEHRKAAYVLTVCIAGPIIICCIPCLFHLLLNGAGRSKPPSQRGKTARTLTRQAGFFVQSAEIFNFPRIPPFLKKGGRPRILSHERPAAPAAFPASPPAEMGCRAQICQKKLLNPVRFCRGSTLSFLDSPRPI